MMSQTVLTDHSAGDHDERRVTDGPLVSAIIIFLNAEKFIQEAIESVFAQTYRHWELILVDDGSNDASSDIARAYAERYPDRVRYVEHDRHQNLGMSASRNRGIRMSQGKYIAHLDADDVWLPNTLADQVAILEAHPEAAMVYGPAERWHSWSGRPEDVERDVVEDLGIPANSVVKPPALLTLFLRDESAKPTGPMVRREVVERVGGYEDAFRGRYEDQVFCAKVCLSEMVYVADTCWYRYRRHPDACCAPERAGKSYSDYRLARLRFLNWLTRYVSPIGLKDPELRRVLRNERWRVRYPNFHRQLERMYQLATRTRKITLSIAQRALPPPARNWIWARLRGEDYCPPVGWVRFGSLRRVTPLSRTWGFDRGLPVDRYYIERFLGSHAADVRGHVLEIGDDTYTRKFGGARVTRSDVLHVCDRSPRTTIVADLTHAEGIPSNTFDCIIFTQTLPFIYDTRAALQSLNRILKPGGVLLATFPGITRISPSDMSKWGHYWSFTSLSARRLFEEAFSPGSVSCETHGNVLAATAFLYGLSATELRPTELDYRDPDYELLITVRAIKQE
jgi:glycosyltransferase involved in cell wall biosynthesis